MPAMDVTNRVAVITGASRGLGAGLARDFLSRGMRVGVCARTEPAVDSGERVVSAAVDVTDEAAVEAFVARVTEQLGPIDLWINNAGVLAPIGPVRDLDADEFRTLIDINVVGVFLGSRAFVRHLRETGRPGVLINVSSGAAYNGYAGWSAYCASKAAVDLFTESLQLEEADTGLRAHAVAPGVIDTDMQALIRSMPKDRFPMVDKFLAMKRDNSFRTPAQVAADFLALSFDPKSHRDEVRLSMR